LRIRSGVYKVTDGSPVLVAWMLRPLERRLPAGTYTGHPWLEEFNDFSTHAQVLALIDAART
jgi:hypothetical protein